MGKTKLIKVLASERLPSSHGRYLARVKDYLSFESYHFDTFKNDFITSFEIEEWLEEVPDEDLQIHTKILELKIAINLMEIEANKTAKSLNQRGMESSYYSSKAMALAYKFSGKKVDELLRELIPKLK